MASPTRTGSPTRGVRLSAPLMHAFRAAHAAKDARKKLDLRDGGERVIAGRRASARAFVSEALLRQEIARDLEQLLNTTNLASIEDLSGYERIPASILNYGIPDMVHRTIDEDTLDEVAGELETALTRFEPRIVARTLRIRRDVAIDAAELKLRFVIDAEIAMEPENIPVEFVADVETGTGNVVVNQI